MCCKSLEGEVPPVRGGFSITSAAAVEPPTARTAGARRQASGTGVPTDSHDGRHDGNGFPCQ